MTMNQIDYSISNQASGVRTAVLKSNKKAGKRRKLLMTTSLLICSTPSWALPTGDQLLAGQANVTIPSANVMQIDQTSQQAIINWQTFSIAQNQAVNIQQPNANAALLNRVVGQDVSQIQGQLNANGRVYLVNPNGVLFSNTAQVDVGGLIASTHNISNADFLNGRQHFTQDGATGAIDNQGTIKIPAGSVVAFIAQTLSNTGTIETPNGVTAFAAGKTVDVDFKGDGLVAVKISESALNAHITNKGGILAVGGNVILTAKAAGQLMDTVINQQGIIRAQELIERNGEIVLDTGKVDVSGITGGINELTVNSVITVIPAFKPVIQSSDNVLTQVSALQRSNFSLPDNQEKPVDNTNDRLDIVSEGLKRPLKLHTIISLSICAIGTR
jgi:filamentous hemagglutinin family protein